MKKLFPMILILCMLGAWASIAYRTIQVPKEYASVLSDAQEAYNKGYYLKAHELLQKANALQDITASYKTQKLMRDVLYGLDYKSDYMDLLYSLVENYPQEVENYEKLVAALIDDNDYNELYEKVPEYFSLFPESVYLKEIDDTLRKNITYIEINSYNVEYISPELVLIQDFEINIEDENEAPQKHIYDNKGKKEFNFDFPKIVPSYDKSSLFVCDEEGSWRLINTDGNLLADNKEQKIDEIYTLAENGLALSKTGDKYRYVNDEMRVSSYEWEDATSFSQGIAAVKKNGKWAVVTTDNWRTTEDFIYTDVPKNIMGTVNGEGCVVVADSSGYFILDTVENKPVSEARYTEMKAFLSRQPVPYRTGELWGFVGRSGNIIFEAKYEDATPFINGYAAVKKDGLWGYIDQTGNWAVEPNYLEAYPVMNGGRAYVKNSKGYWDYLTIERLKYVN